MRRRSAACNREKNPPKTPPRWQRWPSADWPTRTRTVHSECVLLRSPRRAFAATLALVAALALSACDPAAVETPGNGASAGTGSAADARAQLDSLTVAVAASMSGYSRDRFPHWISQGGGCDTRDTVLKRDGKDVKATADCKITSGSWLSPYNNTTYTDPKKLDIDHMVPLAAAWRSGANKWTDDQRQGFANDLTRPQLYAVDLSDNRSKGDQDPSQWKPPNHAFWCTYAQSWITVKTYYKLAVTSAEKTALQDMLGTCG
jgi:hypothetical protein